MLYIYFVTKLPGVNNYAGVDSRFVTKKTGDTEQLEDICSEKKKKRFCALGENFSLIWSVFLDGLYNLVV